MLHYLRIAVTALSLTACVLLVALWVRSYSREVIVGHIDSHSRGWHLVSSRGRILLNAADYDAANPGNWRRYVAWEPGIFGFSAFRTGQSFSVRIPYWFPTMLCALLTAASWFKWRVSLRTLLIVTTLIAVVLGIVVAAR